MSKNFWLSISHFLIHSPKDVGLLQRLLGFLLTKKWTLPQFCQCQAGILWQGLRWSLCTGWHSHSPWSYLVWGWALAGCGLHIHAAEHAPGPHCEMRGKRVKSWLKHWPKHTQKNSHTDTTLKKNTCLCILQDSGDRQVSYAKSLMTLDINKDLITELKYLYTTWIIQFFHYLKECGWKSYQSHHKNSCTAAFGRELKNVCKVFIKF